jgi:hypothetical protein
LQKELFNICELSFFKKDAGNRKKPETWETTEAAGTSSSWDCSNSRYHIHIRDPEKEKNAIRKTATAGPTAAQ